MSSPHAAFAESPHGVRIESPHGVFGGLLAEPVVYIGYMTNQSGTWKGRVKAIERGQELWDLDLSGSFRPSFSQDDTDWFLTVSSTGLYAWQANSRHVQHIQFDGSLGVNLNDTLSEVMRVCVAKAGEVWMRGNVSVPQQTTEDHVYVFSPDLTTYTSAETTLQDFTGYLSSFYGSNTRVARLNSSGTITVTEHDNDGFDRWWDLNANGGFDNGDRQPHGGFGVAEWELALSVKLDGAAGANVWYCKSRTDSAGARKAGYGKETNDVTGDVTPQSETVIYGAPCGAGESILAGYMHAADDFRFRSLKAQVGTPTENWVFDPAAVIAGWDKTYRPASIMSFGSDVCVVGQDTNGHLMVARVDPTNGAKRWSFASDIGQHPHDPAIARLVSTAVIGRPGEGHEVSAANTQQHW